MTLRDVLAEVRRRGIRLAAVGDKLRCRPRSAVQAEPDLTPHLKEHKPALLSLLAPERPPAVAAPPEAPPEAPAAPPVSAPDPSGTPGRPLMKEARATVPHELSLNERVASGYINPGWSPADWAARLRQLANRCEAVRPELAATYRRWAANIEKTT